MKKKIQLTAIFVIAAVMFYFSWGRYTQDQLIESEIDRLMEDAYNPVIKLFDYSMLQGLPEPVKRYFKHVLPERTPFIQSVKLVQDGYLSTKPGADWKRLKAYQYFATTEPGFIWLGEVNIIPLIKITARDKYYQGNGEMRVRFANIFDIAMVAGDEMDVSALVRYLSEGVWFPTALLPSKNLRWEAVDSTSAKAHLTDGKITVSGVFHFNEAGEIIRMTTDERYMFKDGKNIREKWSVYCGKYREFEGLKVPAYGEAEWNLDEGDYKYFKSDITDIKFNVHRR